MLVKAVRVVLEVLDVSLGPFGDLHVDEAGDYEPGNLDAMQAIAPSMAPYADTIGGYRCMVLDIVSSGSGGPDFRIDRAQ